jgi:2-polyprenyl-6-methoxyphenol hydroxylase-like FAD-dependent oxidoreductase
VYPYRESAGACTVKVLIVGAGPVGMAMAVLMERFDIEYVVVEVSEGVTDHPKARGCNTRTMELFRQWGLEERVRARGLPDGTDIMAIVDSLSGHEYGRTTAEPNIGHSPSWKCPVAQDVVEEELLASIEAPRCGQVRYSTEFMDLRQGEDRVTVRTRNRKTDAETTWVSEYLIGADGAGSNVRRQSDIEMIGPSTLAVMANDYWKADLSHLPRIKATSFYRIVPQSPDGAIDAVLNTNGRDRWLSVTQVGRDKDDRPLPRNDEEVVQIARKHAGIANLAVKVINRSIWRLSRQVAARFDRGRVFLVGDAAHRFPPFGGFGMNSGIQDAHNLAWKLKLVLDGKAGRALLGTYDQERRPIAESNADFSLSNRSRFENTDIALRSRNPDQIDFWIKDADNHVHNTGQDLGFSYDVGALVPDGTTRTLVSSRYYAPSDRPGGRFPHVWMDLARRESTLDWFDRDLVLVVGAKGDPWLAAAREVSGKKGVAIQTKQLDSTFESAGLELGLRGAVLVRPDGHVAWRMPWLPSDPAQTLAAVVDVVLLRQSN